jgi:TolB-like protein
MGKRITMSKKAVFIKTLFLMAALFLMDYQYAFAQDVKKIVLLPFDVYSKASALNLQETIYKGISSELVKAKNIQLIERSALAKSLEGKRIDEKLSLTIGKETGAHYVIMGSLSEFGKIISVDTRIIDVKEGKTLPVIFTQGKGIESIGSISSQIRTNILITIAADMRITKIDFKGNRKIESSAVSQVLKSARGNLSMM